MFVELIIDPASAADKHCMLTADPITPKLSSALPMPSNSASTYKEIQINGYRYNSMLCCGWEHRNSLRKGETLLFGAPM